MEPRPRPGLTAVFVLIAVLSTGSGDNDLDLVFCGIWRHGNGSPSLSVNLSPGCGGISVLANESSLSIEGQITSQCQYSDMIPLHRIGRGSGKESEFCLYWEPMFDQLKLQVRGENLTLCRPSSLQHSCCTDLTNSANEPAADYGISNATIKGDVITYVTRVGYRFAGDSTPCSDLCNQATRGSTQVNMIDAAENLCAHRVEVEMKDATGHNIISPVAEGLSAKPPPTVHLPPALREATQNANKVACTFFKGNSLFQDGQKEEEVRVLSDVVEITVENEVIANLSEPIRISFHHNAIPQNSRKCVSWDTRKDPLQVNWLEDGCVTRTVGAEETECLCNHLTYFSVLVQIEPRPVRHLLALTAITSVGCAVSAISCVALVVFLCRKRRLKEESTPIHLGLAASLATLNVLFFFTGVLANLGGEALCKWVGAALHYALLSSFTWMGIEIFYTFWLVYIVFRPRPKPYMYNLVGFVVPTVPVIILAAVGDIYGLREVVPSDDVSNPYLMCWMKANTKALLAHYFTNVLVLVMVVCAGSAMLFLVYREIRPREEWKQNRVAVLSIWGLSSLFGTTWGLAFLDFGPLSDLVVFLFCFLNSFQGFFLMLRFYMLEWMRKQTGGSAPGSNSTGSTRQPMIQSHEKS